CVRRGENFDYW
nr:immunoglobulin heavy chain junction region [Macaca mulatta]